MFKSFSHDTYTDEFIIIDDDFTEYIDSTRVSSIWEAIIEVYSKRELNVWSNFARCLIGYSEETLGDIPYMLYYINKELGINTNNLEKYLMLM